MEREKKGSVGSRMALLICPFLGCNDQFSPPLPSKHVRASGQPHEGGNTAAGLSAAEVLCESADPALLPTLKPAAVASRPLLEQDLGRHHSAYY